MRSHLIKRFGFFLLGIALFYAPFAILVRVLVWATDSPLMADAHRVCLRMPVEWLFQPWMYPTMIENPMYLVVLLVLPAVALFFGPLFCGWMCPAGIFPEFMSRLVPEKLQWKPAGRINPSPVRYGVLAAMLVAPFVGAYICCSFCNFAVMQNIVSAAFGDFRLVTHWASITLLTFGIWFVALGLFTKGGRGWCNFICPAGALMGLSHFFGAKLGFTYRLNIDGEQCKNCGDCVKTCNMWALTKEEGIQVNRHACNLCLDCVHACKNGAISFSKGNGTVSDKKEVQPQ